MLEKPHIQDERIVACLRQAYGLQVSRFTFLPIGADRDTAVYRAAGGDGAPYFVKLRRGAFDEIAVALPRFLSDQGIAQIIPPLATSAGQLWANLDEFTVILYPFVEGRDAYDVNLSDRHWVELGRAFRGIHAARLPPTLRARIQPESYSPQWRETVKAFLARVEDIPIVDPIAAQVVALLREKQHEIAGLVRHTERLLATLQARSLEVVLCHADMHAGNVLISTDDALYIVDWDNPVLAPREHDLMLAGGGLGGKGHTPQQEEALFYQGYGPVQVDPLALAYFRYERIIQDIAIYCEDLLLTGEGGADRAQSFGYLRSNFLPDSVLEIARRADETWPGWKKSEGTP